MRQDLRKTDRPPVRLGQVCLVVAVASMTLPRATVAQWPQFGGPNRNFICDTKGLANKWPDEGPKKLWTRELGDGYSTIIADGGALYTMYRVGEEEFTV